MLIEVEESKLIEIYNELENAKNAHPASEEHDWSVSHASTLVGDILDEQKNDNTWPAIFKEVFADEEDLEGIKKEYMEGYNLGEQGGYPNESDEPAVLLGWSRGRLGWEEPEEGEDNTNQQENNDE